MADPAAVLRSFKTLALDIHITQYLQAAGLTIYCYDYLLTLNDEIRLMWFSRWSLVKTLFIINRYSIPIAMCMSAYVTAGFGTFSIETCQRISFISSIWIVLTFALWNFLMSIRVHALWGRSTLFGYLLFGLWAATTAFAITLTIIHVRLIVVHAIVAEDLKLCTPTMIPKLYYIVWIPSMAFEAMLFVMSCASLWHPGRRAASTLAQVMLRDGLIYFLLITGARVANLFLFIEGSDAVVFAALFGFFPIGGTLISRLTLNLRASGKEGFATRDDQTWAGQRPQYGAPAQVFGSTAPPRSTVAFPVPVRSPISEAYELRTLQTSHDVSMSSLPDSSSLDVKNGAYV